MNFFDPRLTSDGKLYAPQRFKEIVKERYIISSHTHTSYADVGDISPIERRHLLDFIIEDVNRKNEITEKITSQMNSQ